LLPEAAAARATAKAYDVIVYGATPAGVTAAVEAGRHGLSVLLVEPGGWVGGMTASGLGVTDKGNGQTITGLARDFYRTVCREYDAPGSAALAQCLTLPYSAGNPPFYFEPHIAAAAFDAMLGAAPQGGHITKKYRTSILSLQKNGATLTAASLSDGSIPAATVFIDATYEGDLLKLAGVSYTVGREANAHYNETYNGWQPPYTPSFPVDPFVTPGLPGSGLLYGLAEPPAPLPAIGTADHDVMAYDYRLCVTNVAANAVPFTTRPPGYVADHYTLLGRYLAGLAATRNCNLDSDQCVTLNDVIGLGPGHALPHGKFDVGNGHIPISIDLTGLSATYPDGSGATRAFIATQHRKWMQGLLYYLATAPAAPGGLRADLATYGLCKDEFADTGNWPHQLYVREARRMIGGYVVTEGDMLRTAPPVPDGIALASFPADSHDTLRFPVQRTSATGQTAWSFAVEGGSYDLIPNPFPISYRALVPNAAEATNLLETIALSASHSAYRAIRTEPQYMMLGHAAGAAAVLAVTGGVPVQAVPAARLQSLVSAEGLLVSFPAILGVTDAGARSGGRLVELNGQFPGVGAQYGADPSALKETSCCWPDQAASLTSACAASTTALTGFSASRVDIVVRYGALSSAAYCAFRVTRQDPAVAGAITSASVYATLQAE
jgi:hypothetical protein